MILVTYLPITGNLADYDVVMSQLVYPMPGNLFHASYSLDDGKFGVVEVWESREAWESFSSVLLPLVQAVGTDIGTPQVRSVYRAFSTEFSV